MKINMTTKTDKISGCRPICIVRVEDGYRGTWADDYGYDIDKNELENDLENNADVIDYSVN